MTTRRRSIGNLVAMAFLVAASLMARSWLADGLRYLAFGYIAGDLIFRAWAGYRRRRPHWTRDSWRGYLLACVVPAVALVIMVFMMAALEWKLPHGGRESFHDSRCLGRRHDCHHACRRCWSGERD